MSQADLRRLIHRATPRIEDHRCIDRTDFIRREHGHLTFREVVDAVDALEFTAVSFVEGMCELQAEVPRDQPQVQEQQQIEGATTAEVAGETAVHGLFRVLDGLQVLQPSLRVFSTEVVSTEEAAAAAGDEDDGDNDVRGAPGWEDTVATSRKLGAELFKKKDFEGAARKYTMALVAAPLPSAGGGSVERHTLYSNRSAAFLQLGMADGALLDALRCIRSAPEWPKGHFRAGCCYRQLGRHAAAIRAFDAGRQLEPENPDWEREVQKTRVALWATLPCLVRQLLLSMLPEILRAWNRCGVANGVLQLQVNGSLEELGQPRWHLLREKREPAKAQVRYAFFSSRKDYLANLASNVLQRPPGVAGADLDGRPLKVAEVGKFFEENTGAGAAAVHIDVNSAAVDGKPAAILCVLPCGEDICCYLAQHKDPPAPQGSVEGVMQAQKTSFPKSFPNLLGFQNNLAGDLNFPVVDTDRDMSGNVA
eukprot:TRINITY_DN13033_c0_g1_i1.p1 TRINITY_DN13033_c0_g1~~TRINITY_DN13033_c0_g1_i1.p1  ORF type:complete len:503 (+),score=92.76 TRINITY_DN13033_c0_g1_i1:74-1510(+)